MDDDLAFRAFDPAGDGASLDALVETYLDIFNEPATLAQVSSTLRPFEASALREWFLDGPCRCFVCHETGGRIVGFQVAVPDPLEGYELWGAGVVPDRRRRGIGRALVERAVRDAAADGYHAVDALVFADNAPRLRLLIGFGFAPVALTANARADGGDLVRLRKVLPS